MGEERAGVQKEHGEKKKYKPLMAGLRSMRDERKAEELGARLRQIEMRAMRFTILPLR